MRKKWNKKPLILTAAALTLTAAVSVGSAMAYFTTYSDAEGSVTMDLGFTTTEIHERVEGGKFVSIENTGDYDYFVRVKVFSDVPITEVAGENWEKKGDYWEYTSVLEPEETTSELKISYDIPEEQEDDVNIIVVHECTPVTYDENGNPVADWNFAISSEDAN